MASELSPGLSIAPAGQSLYQINTLPWLQKWGSGASLADVPQDYWNEQARDHNYLWLMGVWERAPLVEYLWGREDLRQHYQNVLVDLVKQDIAGSAFAIDNYSVSGLLGGEEALQIARERINRAGMELILCTVPNHFGRNSSVSRTNFGLFLPAFAEVNSELICSTDNGSLLHGMDPICWREGLGCWSDTLQLNHWNPQTIEFMRGQFEKVAGLCDGTRNDMAQLLLNDVFEFTWGPVLKHFGIRRPAKESWETYVEAIRAVNPGFKLIGEVYYWGDAYPHRGDFGFQLQQLGFDFTYSKDLYDRLTALISQEDVDKKHGGNWARAYQNIAGEVRAYFKHAALEYQKKTVVSTENHDEPRAMRAFGFHNRDQKVPDPELARKKSLAAAVIIGTAPSLRHYYDGQYEGALAETHVQLGRMPDEETDPKIAAFYDRFRNITREEVFRCGDWTLVDPSSSGDDTFNNFVACNWTLGNERRLVVVNYSPYSSKGHLRLDFGRSVDTMAFRDLLHDRNYRYPASDLGDNGLFVSLEPWKAHIFKY